MKINQKRLFKPTGALLVWCFVQAGMLRFVCCKLSRVSACSNQSCVTLKSSFHCGSDLLLIFIRFYLILVISELISFDLFVGWLAGSQLRLRSIRTRWQSQIFARCRNVCTEADEARKESKFEKLHFTWLVVVVLTTLIAGGCVVWFRFDRVLQ